MSQIITRGITANAVDDTLIRLRSNQPLRSRNNANAADLNILKTDASDIVQFLRQTQIATVPSAANDVTNKTYVDAQIVAAGSTWNKETFTLNGADITNQYIDLAHVAKTSSIHFVVKGFIPQLETDDYTVSYAGGAGGNTRITFAGDNATGGNSALVSGDKIQVQYQY